MRTQSALAERLGVAHDLLAALYHIDQHRDQFTPAQLAAIQYAERLTTGADSIDARLWQTVQDAFADDAIVELTAIISFVNYLNRCADAFGLT